MLLGYTDIRKGVKGTFKEYDVHVIVKRTKASEQFGCFVDNDKTTYEYDLKVYARNDKDIEAIVEEWNRQGLNVWTYSVKTPSESKWLSVDEVLDTIQAKSGFRFLPTYSEFNARDYIR